MSFRMRASQPKPSAVTVSSLSTIRSIGKAIDCRLKQAQILARALAAVLVADGADDDDGPAPLTLAKWRSTNRRSVHRVVEIWCNSDDLDA